MAPTEQEIDAAVDTDPFEGLAPVSSDDPFSGLEEEPTISAGGSSLAEALNKLFPSGGGIGTLAGAPPVDFPLSDETVGDIATDIIAGGIGGGVGGAIIKKGIGLAAPSIAQAARPFIGNALRFVAGPVAGAATETAISEGAETLGIRSPQDAYTTFGVSLASEYGAQLIRGMVGKVLGRNEAIQEAAETPGNMLKSIYERKNLPLPEHYRISDVADTEDVIASSGLLEGGNVFDPKTLRMINEGGVSPTLTKPRGFSLKDVKQRIDDALPSIIKERTNTAKTLDRGLAALQKIDPETFRGITLTQPELAEPLAKLEEMVAGRGGSAFGELQERSPILKKKLSEIKGFFGRTGELNFSEAVKFQGDIYEVLRELRAFDSSLGSKIVLQGQSATQVLGGANKDVIAALSSIAGGVSNAIKANSEKVLNGFVGFAEQRAKGALPGIAGEASELPVWKTISREELGTAAGRIQNLNSLYRAFHTWSGELEKTLGRQEMPVATRPMSGLLNVMRGPVKATTEGVERLAKIPEEEIVASENAILDRLIEYSGRRMNPAKYAPEPRSIRAALYSAAQDPVMGQAVTRAAMELGLNIKDISELTKMQMEAILAGLAQQQPELVEQKLGASPIPGVKSYFGGKIIDPKEREQFAPILDDIKSSKVKMKALSAFHKDGTILPEVMYEFGWADSIQQPGLPSGLNAAQLTPQEPTPTVTTVADGLRRMEYDY